MSILPNTDSQRLYASPKTGGSITLVRHGEPALSRKITLNSDEYRAWWGRYEEGGILAGQTPPASLREIARDADVIFVSTRLRARESAAAIVGEKAVTLDANLIEAPLPPPPIPSFVRFNPKTWGFWTRVMWWYFNRHEDQESRAQAEVRAGAVADALIAKAATGQAVLVVAHGFFNTMIGIALKKRGWAHVSGKGHRYWTAKRYERR